MGYLYDDRGFRLAKLNFTTERTTWYIRDASGNVISTYEETGVSAATRDEGGIHPPQPPIWVVQTEIPIYGSGKLGVYYPRQEASVNYEITDHLGNVRALLRDNISIYTATMEDNGLTGEDNPRNEEKAYFQNIEETVVTDARMNHTEATPYGTPDKAAYLFWNDTQGTLAEEKAIGPAIALRVQPGDMLEIETWSRFERKNDYTHDFGLVALSALLGNTFSASGGFEGFTLNNTISNLEGALTAGAFPDDGGDDTRPFAYLNYIIYDEDMVYQSAGWRRVTDDAGFYPEEIGLPEKTPVRVAFEQPITINESGYIYVWVSNQSKETRVWFDDLQVTHNQSIVVQATDYGVWGDVLREQKTDESIYRFGYQGQFAEKDEETGWNHFELREYDPVIGRWTSIDPYGQYWSPYNGMGNNPVSSVDPNGGWSRLGAWWRSGFGLHGSIYQSGEDGGKEVWGFNGPDGKAYFGEDARSGLKALGIGGNNGVFNKIGSEFDQMSSAQMSIPDRVIYQYGGNGIEMVNVEVQAAFLVTTWGIGNGAAVAAATGGATRAATWGSGWMKASLQKAIARHAGANYTSWTTNTGKVIFENPATGRQVVLDVSGKYFKIFQPKVHGSMKGQYLDLMGNIPGTTTFTKGGIKTIQLQGDAFKQATHFLVE